MILTKQVLLCAAFLSNFIYAAPVPPEHKAHCDKWEMGRCTEGALSKLALNKNPSETCDKVCQDGCPKCINCGFCGLCSLYSNSACENVAYFTDRETCNIEYTTDCCDLCRVQCESDEGVCSSEGFCNGGSAKTDLLTYCIEKTTNDQCVSCVN